MTAPLTGLLEAVSFAARAHRHQIRKDQETPYAAHPMRVCLVLQRLFSLDDLPTLTAAVLHDTIEDTTTDYDDLAERFGETVADWVAILSKDTRQRDDRREPAYFAALAAACWQVQAIKLADLYDNLADLHHQPPAKQQRFRHRTREFLDFFKPHLKPEVVGFFAVTEAKLNEAG